MKAAAQAFELHKESDEALERRHFNSPVVVELVEHIARVPGRCVAAAARAVSSPGKKGAISARSWRAQSSMGDMASELTEKDNGVYGVRRMLQLVDHGQLHALRQLLPDLLPLRDSALVQEYK